MAPHPSPTDTAALIWNVADLLRGRFKQSEYGKVILPFTVLRRLDCVLAPTREAVQAEYQKRKDSGIENPEPFLTRAAKLSFYNIAPLTFAGLLDDPANVRQNLEAFTAGFSENVRDIFERFKLGQVAADLEEKNLLFKVIQKFASVDLHPDVVSNHDMGLMFENLIRRFAEISNDTAGEHYTPREVIRLMVDILFAPDEEALTKSGVVRSFYDPTAGTGGILSIAEEHVRSMNLGAKLVVFGQELNPESYAICKADLLIKGQDASNIVYGNTLSEDGHVGRKFDYMGANPPYGVKWEEAEEAVRREHERKGFAGRFGPELPRINDGSLLFLLHMMSKMSPKGSRIGIVFNASPLFSGDAGSGESEIRRWIIENDRLEAVISLPRDLFYNTGLTTYIWIVTNQKAEKRQGYVQLVNASGFFAKMPKSLGSKRNYITDEQIAEIVRIYCSAEDGPCSRILRNEDFGYRQITIERPLRLRFQVTPERLERLGAASALSGNGRTGKSRKAAGETSATAALLSALATVPTDRIFRSRAAFVQVLDEVLDKAGVRLTAPVRKAVLSAFAERDEEAEICRDAKGNMEPDPDLRDIENVPLTESVTAFFKREVLPYAPDAWISPEKERIGYEVPFASYFFQPEDLRPLHEVEAEIRTLQADLAALFEQVIS